MDRPNERELGNLCTSRHSREGGNPVLAFCLQNQDQTGLTSHPAVEKHSGSRRNDKIPGCAEIPLKPV
jgi:hypothetical protein